MNNIKSLLYSLITKPSIDSPIHFNDRGLSLQEFSMTSMPITLRQEFIEFCYPPDIPNREDEIDLDQSLWNSGSVFIVFNAGIIVGCVMYIEKEKCNRLPLEYSTDISGKPFTIPKAISKPAEIYHLRRSFTLSRKHVPVVISMLFKAVWAKAIQCETDHFYCTVDPNTSNLKSLYEKRLAFKDVSTITYNNKDWWRVYQKDCCWHDNHFALLSNEHYKMQKYFRKNLAQPVHPKSLTSFLKFVLNIRKTILGSSKKKPIGMYKLATTET